MVKSISKLKYLQYSENKNIKNNQKLLCQLRRLSTLSQSKQQLRKVLDLNIFCLLSLLQTLKPLYNITLHSDSHQPTIINQVIAQSRNHTVFDIFYLPEILGVNQNATEKEIKSAYYRLAKQYHPDVNNLRNQKNAHNRFSEINMYEFHFKQNRAYENMIKSMAQGSKYTQAKPSEQKKAKQYQKKQQSEYEKNYSQAKQNRGKQKRNNFQQEQSEQQLTQQDFNEFQKAFKSYINKGKIDPKHRVYSRFFTQFFTGNQSHSQKHSPFSDFENIHDEDDELISTKQLKMITINAKLNITKQEAEEGVTKNVLYKKTIICQGCFGKSSESKRIKCRKCSGSGFVGKNIQDIHCCSACNGGGTVRNPSCKQCKGKGSVQIHAEQPVAVPKSAYNNQQIILRGRGNQHLKKTYFGDVYIKLRINIKPLVRVQGMNTFSMAKISLFQAILGAQIQYPSLRGNKKYEIDHEIKNYEEQVVIKGEGIKKGSKAGDHFLRIKVDVPKIFGKREGEILTRLREIQKGKVERRTKQKKEQKQNGKENMQNVK